MAATRASRLALALIACIQLSACTQGSDNSHGDLSLAGAWRSTVDFKTGALASIEGFEFMYVFNRGGTLTESSNFDAAPPVPPAYGIWRPLGKDRYEAQYEFFITRPPTATEAGAGAVGWLPGGSGRLVEAITVSSDGNSFTSTIRYEILDQAGKPVEGGGVGEGHAARMKFDTIDE